MKTLVLDLGNSTLFAGLFAGERMVRSTRPDVGRGLRTPPSNENTAQARYGNPALPLKAFARGNVDRITLCSVVPGSTAALVEVVRRAFGIMPLELTPLADHGLTLAYREPKQLGADRLAAALGARLLFPRRHVIIVDCGTATTLTFVHRDGTLLGGAILPGLGLWPQALAQHTARLPEVALRPAPRRVVARDTAGALRSGMVHGHAGAIRELVLAGRREAFGRAAAVVVGTGGQVTHFKDHRLFTTVEPALILHGLFAFTSRSATHA